MPPKTVAGTIRVTPITSGQEPFARFSIEIKDELSNSLIAQVEMDCSQFGRFVSGQLIRNVGVAVAENHVTGSEGKGRWYTTMAPFLGHDKHKYEAWLREYMQPCLKPGYYIDSCLDCKDSIKYIPGGTILRYRVLWHEGLYAAGRQSQDGVDK